MTNLAIRNEHQQFPHFTSGTWGDIPPGDRFVALGDDPTITLCYEPQKRSHDDLIRDLELLLRSAGSIEPFYEKRFAGLEDKTEISKRYEIQNYDSPSTTTIHDPVSEPLLNALADACPSLDSDHGGSSDGTEDGDVPTAPEAVSIIPTASGRSPAQRDNPPLYASIRRVLISDSSFAERIIAAIKQLPIDKRQCLVGYDAECVDGSSSGPSKSGDRPSKRRRTGDKSKQNGSSSRANGNGGTGGADNDKANDNEGEGEGDGDGDGDGDGTSSSDTIPNQDEKCGWICPFFLAYPGIVKIGRFSNCLSANMTERYMWKSHLLTHHSQGERGVDLKAEKYAKFFMTSEKLDTVIEKIDAHNERPRDKEKRKKSLMALFIGVWDTIFPPNEFPDMKRPLSQFHFNEAECADLGQHLANRVETLVEVMYGAKAEATVPQSDCQSDNMKEIISKAIAVILLNSPAATGATQWLARASTDAVEAAGRQHRDNHVFRPTTLQCDEQAEPKNAETFASPEIPTVPQTPHIAPAGPDPTYTLPVTLFPNGTQVELVLGNGSQIQSNTQRVYLEVSSPFYVASMRQVPFQPSPIGTAMTMNQISSTPNNVIPSAEALMHSHDLTANDTLLGSQGDFMSMMSSELINPEEWNIENVLSKLG
ncbi:Ff.00g022720.m01.CDS01 [Fusarium sp. VM40]|nr:Ff.00g022720.m01.CDS01 [Fusarium sp. VM40]